MAEFVYPDTVKRVIQAASARVPRLQPSFIKEIGEVVSQQVTAGDWPGDEAGNPLNSAGQNPEDFVDHYTSTRPHGEIPAVLADPADDTWTSGSLTKQGKRWRELKAYLGSDKAADEAMAEEAARYGTVPGSTKPGVKPGEKQADEKSSAPSPSNPWNPKTKFTPQEALAEQKRLLRTLGAEACIREAAKCGVSVFGVPLRRK